MSCKLIFISKVDPPEVSKAGWDPLRFYAALGVGREASACDITVAFRREIWDAHARAEHDDESRAHYMRVTEGHRVLSHERRRRFYDLYGQNPLEEPGKTHYRLFENIVESVDEDMRDVLAMLAAMKRDVQVVRRHLEGLRRSFNRLSEASADLGDEFLKLAERLPAMLEKRIADEFGSIRARIRQEIEDAVLSDLKRQGGVSELER